MSSVFPRALRASETSSVPKLVFIRLRAKAIIGLGLSKKGANPFFGLSLGLSHVDPQFVQLCRRIQLFRQVLHELPANTALDCLASTRGRPLVGFHVGAPVFVIAGRSLHILLIPFARLLLLLSSSWADSVVERVTTEKVWKIWPLWIWICRAGIFVPRGMASCSVSKLVLFIEGFHRHIPGPCLNCPLCHLPDSREHCLEICSHASSFRN